MNEKTKNNKVRCNLCNKYRKIEEFYRSSLLKKDYQCKDCKRIKREKNSKEITDLIGKYYRRHKHNKKRLSVRYTNKELYDWAKKDKKFISLLNQWIFNDYRDDIKPAIIRKDVNKEYTLDNLLAIEKYRVNSYRIDSRTRLVKQYDLDGNYIATYPNACVAARILGFKTYAGINEVCKGNRKICNGYYWTYGPSANIVRNSI